MKATKERCQHMKGIQALIIASSPVLVWVAPQYPQEPLIAVVLDTVHLMECSSCEVEWSK